MRRPWSTSATLGEHDGSQGGGKGSIIGCTLQWRQTDEDCNNQLTMMGVHPQQLQAQEERLRSCPHQGNGGDVINCQLSAVVTVKLHWQRLGGERGQERHDCGWAGRVVACEGVECLSCIISLLFHPVRSVRSVVCCLFGQFGRLGPFRPCRPFRPFCPFIIFSVPFCSVRSVCSVRSLDSVRSVHLVSLVS